MVQASSYNLLFMFKNQKEPQKKFIGYKEKNAKVENRTREKSF